MNLLDPGTMLSEPMTRLLTIAAVLASLALAACGGDDEDSGATTTPAAAAGRETASAEKPASADKGSGGGEEQKPATGTTIDVADSQYGSILFDSDQQAIYLFDKETSDTSECYGDCAAAWPPVLTDGDPQAGNGIDAKLLGTTERDDGSTQVTYGGHPLYYYVDDGPGQVLCHNVEEFGGLWLVVTPSGDAVQ
jgi:predicted lipoprotein with Yx(FWY)xxD motif